MSNYYSILSKLAPPPCQVEAQESHHTITTKRGVLTGSIPSAITNSGASSHVGTALDAYKGAFIPTGKRSHKVFELPDGTKKSASEIQELQHDIRQPAKDIHIMPNICKNSLISTAKFAKAGYITIFDDKEVNVYNAQNTKVIVTWQAIIKGWFGKKANLWQISLVPIVLDNNTDTVLVKKAPPEFLPNRPPPTEAVHNVYKLKTQPELVRYLHAAAGFPTKPTWVAAIKNRQYTSWPGLTVKVTAKHFPESNKTTKEHGRKVRSGLRSTQPKPTTDDNDNPNPPGNTIRPINKEHDIFIKIYMVEEEANKTVFTNQTGQFPKKSSQGNQYIMVLTHINSNAILQEAMKNCTSGEMIRAYQVLIDQLRRVGVTPKQHILDNKCSADLRPQSKRTT
jgi:hypothetical protein